MQIAERQSGSVTVLDLSGKITLGEDGTLLKDKLHSLLHQGKKTILLNLGQVQYVDSAGLGALVSAYTTVTREGGVAEAGERHQEAAGSAVNHEAADGLRHLRFGRRGGQQLQVTGDRVELAILVNLELPEDDNPIRVSALRVVSDPPAVGGFRELLRVDDDEQGLETGRDAAGQYRFLELDLSVPDFADFKRDVTAGPQHASQLTKHIGHRRLPVRHFLAHRDVNVCRVDAAEPSSEPVIRRVVHDVQKWR